MPAIFHSNKPSIRDLASLHHSWQRHPRYYRCVGHWLLNEVGGNVVYDWSRFKYHGTAVNDPAFVAGQFGTARQFSSADNYVQLPNAARAGQVFACSFWFKKADDGLSYPVLVGADAAASLQSGGFNVFFTHTTDRTRFELVDNLVARQSIQGADYTGDFDWHHIVAQSDGSNYFLYEDGILTASAAKTVTIDWGSRLFAIAKLAVNDPGPGADTFTGIIDDVRMYDRALSVNEIQSLCWQPLLEFEWAQRKRQRRRFYSVTAAGNPYYYYANQFLVR